MTVEELDYGRYSYLMGLLIRKLNLLNKDQKVCYGLTIPQCYAIETLGQRGKLTMNDLSRELGTAISTVTRVVDVLVRDGVLQRSDSPGDRRRVCVELTAKGKELEQKLQQCSDDYSREILGFIPAEKRRDILESLELLIRAVDAVKQKCCKK
ncbi:MAG: MarR family transcriptional regulator [Candidatus Aminicenantes bacterium]|nr:MarR family transcriptional regulator [Candidatus Aminicenantes bacterium]